jgi:hypothetical protein
MNKLVFSKMLENEKLLNHFKEQSYWIKELNRNPSSFVNFEKQMKALYKERSSDKINSALDSIDIISSIIDTL